VAVYARRASSSHNRRTAALPVGRAATVECQLINQTSRLLGLFRLLLDCADAFLLAAMNHVGPPITYIGQGCILIPEQHVERAALRFFDAILAAEIELSLSTLQSFTTTLGRPSSIGKEEKMPTTFTVNGRAASTDAPPATPLLWVIREGLKLTGTKFGCRLTCEGSRIFSVTQHLP